jgi:hypothetical protein
MIQFNVRGAQALCALALALCAAPVHAAALIASGYFEDYKSQTCAPPAAAAAPGPVVTCELHFSAVPANSTLIVENISCRVTTTATNGTVTRFYFFGNGKGQNYMTFTAQTANGARNYHSNQALTKVFTAGQLPKFAVSFTPVISFSWGCNISGQIRSTNPL